MSHSKIIIKVVMVSLLAIIVASCATHPRTYTIYPNTNVDKAQNAIIKGKPEEAQKIFIYSANQGDFYSIEEILKRNPGFKHKKSPTENISLLSSALINACSGTTNFDVVNFLLKNGADVNGDYKASIDDGNVNTPLNAAIDSIGSNDKKKVQLIKILINAGADVNISTKKSGTPYQVAYKRMSTEVMAMLIKAGARDTNADKALAEKAILDQITIYQKHIDFIKSYL